MKELGSIRIDDRGFINIFDGATEIPYYHHQLRRHVCEDNCSMGAQADVTHTPSSFHFTNTASAPSCRMSPDSILLAPGKCQAALLGSLTVQACLLCALFWQAAWPSRDKGICLLISSWSKSSSEDASCALVGMVLLLQSYACLRDRCVICVCTSYSPHLYLNLKGQSTNSAPRTFSRSTR